MMIIVTLALWFLLFRQTISGRNFNKVLIGPCGDLVAP